MNADRIWQAIFYVSMAVLTLWLVLKVAGIINTPVWLEYGVPVASVILAFLAYYHQIVGSITKISIHLAQLNVRFAHVETDVSVLKSDVSSLKTNVVSLTSDVHALKDRIVRIEHEVAST